ncbi:hypothetical protein AWB68_08295 [Caballeronia choica]|uniref:Uncharacterized protein n=1 Tax=Caballeronia choica TaxID=326476 RepID=A0A158L2H0_9BURK|nr:hypothetical protein [Caballeronia choica]SAL87153.1 hypothetical protein AWB68_08295 [Caballeronia choica]
MTLQKRPTHTARSTDAAEAFVEGAHDTVGKAPKLTRDKKQKISVELYPSFWRTSTRSRTSCT